MKVYGIKDAQVQIQMEVIDIVDSLPSFSSAAQGKVVFHRTDGLMIFVDNEWQKVTVQTVVEQNVMTPKEQDSFEFKGIVWDIGTDGKAAILESSMRAALLTLRGMPFEQPALIKTASGDSKFLSAQEVSALAIAMLDHLNTRRY